jgi:hypothetical protein
MDGSRDFEQKLAEQLALLADASLALDGGKAYQTKNISTRLYVICHDLARDKRWHEWAGRDLRIFSTAIPPVPGNLIVSHHPLASIGFGPNGSSFTPHGSQPPPNKVKFSKFSKWWIETVIRTEAGRTLSRKNIVYQMRSYDGGSHGFEKPPTKEYSEALDDRGLGWTAVHENRLADFKLSALEATVRQIAHELLYSLVPRISPKQRAVIDYDTMWSPHDSGEPTVPLPNFQS